MSCINKVLPCCSLRAHISLCQAGGFVQLAKDYQDKGVQLVGISSNSVDVKPMDGPSEMAADAKEQGQLILSCSCILFRQSTLHFEDVLEKPILPFHNSVYLFPVRSSTWEPWICNLFPYGQWGNLKYMAFVADTLTCDCCVVVLDQVETANQMQGIPSHTSLMRTKLLLRAIRQCALQSSFFLTRI